MEDALNRKWPECGPYERALMLALADVVAQRPAGEMEKEAAYHERLSDRVAAQAIRDALVLGRFGVSFSERRLREIMEFMTTPDTSGRFMIGPKVRAEDARLVVGLVVDAPWFKSQQTVPLNIGLPEILRAFAPKPTDHDMEVAMDLDNPTAAYAMRERIEKQNAEREHYIQVLSGELVKALRKWVEAQDPVKGVLPDNILP